MMRQSMVVGVCAAALTLGFAAGIGVAVGVVDHDEPTSSDGAPEELEVTTTDVGLAVSPPSTAAPSTAPPTTVSVPGSTMTPTTPSAPAPQTGIATEGSTFALVDGVMTESFDGAPASPTPWGSRSWDVTVYSRDLETWDELESMHAMHGADCAGPPATHEISAYDDSVFQCRDHMMTAINASGFGAVYLTPAAMVDFSQGAATVRVDVSTLVTSDRDYWDVWITPFEDTIQLPSQRVNGHPRNGVRFRLNTNDLTFQTFVFRDGEEIEVEEASGTSYADVLEPDAARRDTFEMTISRDHLAVGMPNYGLQWTDADIPELGWTRGIVQFAHHSYNPRKADTPSDAHANTWHWDNVQLSSAVPFTIIGTETDYVGGEDAPVPIRFDAPAPEGSSMRFAGIGENLEISVDGGSSWQAAEVQWASDPGGEEHHQSYLTPVPAGTQEILVRGDEWFGGDWRVRDITIWAPPAES